MDQIFIETFEITLFSQPGFSINDLIYINDGSTQSLDISNLISTTPALTTVEVSALTFEPVIESSPGVYTTDPSGWPSNISLTQTSETNTFEIA